MYTFRDLRKAAKKSEIDGQKVKIAVLGNCATQFLATSISGCAKLNGINIEVFDADYNQIDAQLLDPLSEVYLFQPESIVLWLATDKLYEEFLDMSLSERKDFAEGYLSKIKGYWTLIERNSHARILQMNMTEISDKVLGEYSCKVESTFTYQIRKLNFLLQDAMAQDQNVYPIDLLSIQIQLGREIFYDAPLYYHAKMTVSTEALPYLADAVVGVIKAMAGKIKKCIVMDLDNTIWGGVIGDDGLDHIEIGELGRGHVFTNLQRWLKQLREYGVILAVCSKNDEKTAREPFEKHEEMILRLSDISIFVANWNDKASNIKMIQQSLNIGMDSMAFLDDNPFERNLVRNKIPEIEVPELPEDPALYLSFLQKCNYFNALSYAGESADRTKQYQAEFERKKLEQTFDSIDDYLKSLDMVGQMRHFESSKYARIAELTQRSNQFNLRTVRYTEGDIRRIAEDEKYLPLYFTLKDKFGDHGLVSVVILEKVSDQEVFIDTWLMSCRVLKRGMEEFVVNGIIKTAAASGYIKISAEYLPTPKNGMVRDIYRKMGFQETEAGKYFITTADYKIKNVYIQEE